MTWLIFALAAPLLFALTNHIDKLLLSRYFTNVRVNTFLIYTSIASGIIALVILILNPGVFHMPIMDGLLMFAGGVIYFLAIIPYVQALTRDEASRVIPLFQMQPFMAYAFGLLIFHESLSLTQILASIVIIVGAVLISIDFDNHRQFKKIIFGLMALSCLLFMIESVTFKFVGIKYGFWDTSFYQYLGTAVASVMMMLFGKGYRQDFKTVTKDSGAKIFFAALFNELVNIGGRLAFNFALLLAPLAIVTLILGIQPIFVLLIGTLLAIFIPKYGKESLLRRHLLQKVISIAIIFGGTCLLLL